MPLSHMSPEHVFKAPYNDIRRTTTHLDAHADKDVLLIDRSSAIASLVRAKLAATTTARLTHCETLESARQVLSTRKFTIAITALTLPDADRDSILTCLEEFEVPAIVLTGNNDLNARKHYAEFRLVDYFVKTEPTALDQAVATTLRILDNAGFKLLVVDDTRLARTNMVDILRRHNFNVVEANSGRTALEMLNTHRDIDMLVTDFMMPDMDGYELVRRARLQYSSQNLRIIGVTASSDRDLSTLFLKAGASDFMYRPLVAAEFQCRIDNNIETLKQIKRLSFFAERDQLTTLPNRRHFFERALNMLDEDERERRSSAMALLDLDFFKKVNDTYGHEAGDDALRTVANCLRGVIDDTAHMLARVGGEEMALYLRDVTMEEAEDICETIRSTVEAAEIALRNGGSIKITVSIGLVEVQPGEPLNNHMNAADQLLYLAKDRGRNRVFAERMLTAEAETEMPVPA